MGTMSGTTATIAGIENLKNNITSLTLIDYMGLRL